MLSFKDRALLRGLSTENAAIGDIAITGNTPLGRLQLPKALAALELRCLPGLATRKLRVRGYRGITAFVFSDYPKLR